MRKLIPILSIVASQAAFASDPFCWPEPSISACETDWNLAISLPELVIGNGCHNTFAQQCLREDNLPPAQLICKKQSMTNGKDGAKCYAAPRGALLNFSWIVGHGANRLQTQYPHHATIECKPGFTGTVAVRVQIKTGIGEQSTSAISSFQCDGGVVGNPIAAILSDDQSIDVPSDGTAQTSQKP